MCSICHQAVCPPTCPNHEPKAVCECSECGDEIYVGEEYYMIHGSPWCENCIEQCKTEASEEDI